MKRAVEKRIGRHERTSTSLVVRQEFKRRLLKEADYLLRLLHRYESFDEVHHHVIRLFGPWHDRKRTICLQTLADVHGGTDEVRTERLQLYLRGLLLTGLRRFDQSVDVIRTESNCGCAKRDVRERTPLRKYDFGTDRCSRLPAGSCGIVSFLAAREDTAGRILAKLRGIPETHKSTELRNAERFLERFISNPADAASEDPCLTVGDLLIALESAGVSHFFTLNGKESQFLCRALDQTLIVCPVDPLKAEIVCDKHLDNWPTFGPGDESTGSEQS
jgi:hypothetical protein